MIQYIADLSDELSVLAGAMQLPSLAYLLSMARAEAELLALASRQSIASRKLDGGA